MFLLYYIEQQALLASGVPGRPTCKTLWFFPTAFHVNFLDEVILRHVSAGVILFPLSLWFLRYSYSHLSTSLIT